VTTVVNTTAKPTVTELVTQLQSLADSGVITLLWHPPFGLQSTPEHRIDYHWGDRRLLVTELRDESPQDTLHV